ncbi:MAG: T9SS type A sorting domain-containing protein [Saprospiraceae bacterium]|nr:T9SS type A sorting domain-containing protein [Saprospiraceae bacterium]
MFNNAQLELHKNQLSSGMYFYRIEADGKSLDAGKIIVERID